MIAALQAEFDRIAADPSIGVVILAGNGPAFCAGHDLKEMRGADYGASYAEDLFEACARLMQRIVSLPQPVIARVHGIATAAGAQLVASADLAIAADALRERRLLAFKALAPLDAAGVHLHADAAPLTLHSDKLVKLGLGIEGSMAACTLTRLAG